MEESETTTDWTVDLSRRLLKKIERASNESKNAVVLVLNDNDISKIDNLESYINLKKLFLANNQVVRMYGVSHLIHLEVLDLTNNSLVTIEGLKELKNLKELHLGRNKIKTIEHLNNNVNLKKLNLSENNIAYISDISHLHELKELYLHGNKLTNLRLCERYFPKNIEILTLHNNLICDLNEISHLVQFNSVRELTFSKNPCVDFTGNQQAFNYRPFIKNWCSSLTKLDDQPLDDIECLKAEWLYSQGRGRSFKIGEQAALVDYLANVFPTKERNDETEDVKKLKLILSKAQQHQQQLKEQLSTGLPDRMVTSYQDCSSKTRLNSPDLMTRSLDSGICRSYSDAKKDRGEPHHRPLQTSTTFIPIPDTLISPDVCHKTSLFVGSPARTASISSRTSKSSTKNSPHSTPESKRKLATSVRKPTECSSPHLLKKQQRLGNSRSSTPLGSQSSSHASMSLCTTGAKEVECYKVTSDEDSCGKINKQILRSRTLENQENFCKKKREVEIFGTHRNEKEGIGRKEMKADKFANSRAWQAAICIQRRWRGYRARNLNHNVLAVFKEIQLNRMQEYVTKVISEMEATRIALEGNRKLQMLQMQAINAIWKKIVTHQPKEALENSEESTLTLQHIMSTCSNLNKQVEGLQNMMKTLQHSQSYCRSSPMATQTEIVAVHTPQSSDKDTFPYFLKNLEEKQYSFVFQKNEEEFVSSLDPEVTEIYTNKNVTGNASHQEIFLTRNRNEENEIKCSNSELSKPLAKLQGVSTDVRKSEASEPTSPLDKTHDHDEVQHRREQFSFK